MDSISPLKRRSQRGMIDFIKNKDCQWLACTFRVNPTNRTYFSPSESKKHTLQTVKWTIGFIKSEFNCGRNLLFMPFWGGEVKTGVATHVHALLEMPAHINNDLEGKTQIKMNALAKKHFAHLPQQPFISRKFQNQNMHFNYLVTTVCAGKANNSVLEPTN